MAHKIAARNGLAVHAAQEVARRHGIAAERARVLHDANNVVVHLAPSPVVAKLCPAAPGSRAWRKLGIELDVARHLASAGAPVVGPSPELPPGPHAQGAYAMTFWRYQDHDPRAAAAGRAAAQALAHVHEALDSYPGTFPSFLDRQVSRTSRLLADETALSAIPASERAFLRSEYLSITSLLCDARLRCRTLHGDPHRGNLLVSQAGYLMIDFESVCSGPVEWDLSALPGVGAGVFSPDPDLLTLLRRFRSLCVAVWCWTRSRSSATLERAARFHFRMVRAKAPVPRGR
jgi:hypothetical protein